MWNWLVSGLARGATLILYDGSPFARDGRRLIDAIDEERITVFGVGAKYLGALEKSGVVPAESHRLHTLKTVLSTGSPLPHEGFEWVYRAFKPDLHLASISGGTDIVSCFAGGVPTLPVYAGQLQAADLRDGAPSSGTRRAPPPTSARNSCAARPSRRCRSGSWTIRTAHATARRTSNPGPTSGATATSAVNTSATTTARCPGCRPRPLGRRAQSRWRADRYG